VRAFSGRRFYILAPYFDLRFKRSQGLDPTSQQTSDPPLALGFARLLPLAAGDRKMFDIVCVKTLDVRYIPVIGVCARKQS
jgi:hypothetical protein